MESVLSPEGSLALAISALVVVLGWRFALPERGRDFAGMLVFVTAVVLTFAVGRGLIPGSGPTRPGRFCGSPAAHWSSSASCSPARRFKARLLAGRGRLAVTGPYARIRHPLYAGLALVLVGHLLRLPSQPGALAVVVALAQYVWLATVEEREARAAFGAEWAEYAARTRAVLPIPRRAVR